MFTHMLLNTINTFVVYHCCPFGYCSPPSFGSSQLFFNLFDAAACALLVQNTKHWVNHYGTIEAFSNVNMDFWSKQACKRHAKVLTTSKKGCECVLTTLQTGGGVP